MAKPELIQMNRSIDYTTKWNEMNECMNEKNGWTDNRIDRSRCVCVCSSLLNIFWKTSESCFHQRILHIVVQVSSIRLADFHFISGVNNVNIYGTELARACTESESERAQASVQQRRHSKANAMVNIFVFGGCRRHSTQQQPCFSARTMNTHAAYSVYMVQSIYEAVSLMNTERD